MVSEFDFLLLKTRVETLELFTRGMFNGQAKSIQQKWANLHHYLKIYHSELATLCRNLSLSPDRDRADRLRAEIDLACSVSFVRGRLQEVGETQSTYGIAHRIAKMIPYNRSSKLCALTPPHIPTTQRFGSCFTDSPCAGTVSQHLADVW